MTSDRYVFLRAAQDFAAAHGDEYWFHEAYSAAREFDCIESSAERALAHQGLLNAFFRTLYPHRIGS